jgi:predicted aspartyl protease
MVRFKYNQQLSPPAPLAVVSVSPPNGAAHPAMWPAQIDTGADRTVIPARLADELQLPKLDEANVVSLDGIAAVMSTYSVTLKIRDVSAVTVEALCAEGEDIILLGRDVLNHFRITLDGPRQALSIEDAT